MIKEWSHSWGKRLTSWDSPDSAHVNHKTTSNKQLRNKEEWSQTPTAASSLFYLSKNKLQQSKTTLNCNMVEPKMAADLYWLLIGSTVGQMWASMPDPEPTTASERSSRRSLSLSSGLHPSEEHLQSVPVWSSSRGSFFSLFLEDAPLRSFTASHIPRFFVCPKKKKEREKMATSRDIDRHFCGPGRQKSWCKSKTSGDTTRKCSKG